MILIENLTNYIDISKYFDIQIYQIELCRITVARKPLEICRRVKKIAVIH